MNLHLLREHYVFKDGQSTWVPKEAFKSKTIARRRVGNKRHIYTCSVCNQIHAASKIRKRRR